MSDYFDRVERQIVRRVEAGVPGSTPMPGAVGQLGTAAAVLVAIVVAGVFLLVGGAGPSVPARPASTARGVTISFLPRPSLPGGTIGQTMHILRERLGALVPEARVSWAGGRIVVRAPGAKPAVRAQIEALSAEGRLTFYDWEADAIAPNGKTVASQLQAQNPAALTISQGSGSASPGDPGEGSMSLAQALTLAARLDRGTARFAEYIGGVRVWVPPAFVVIQAVAPRAGQAKRQFFLLRDLPALSESYISDPQPGTDPGTDRPDVAFNFTAYGAAAFHRLTATVARRGALVSGLGQTLNQHIAIALDHRLIDVAYIGYKQYPDGISGNQGAELTGSFTTASAKLTAILLRYGPLPIALTATG